LEHYVDLLSAMQKELVYLLSTRWDVDISASCFVYSCHLGVAPIPTLRAVACGGGSWVVAMSVVIVVEMQEDLFRMLDEMMVFPVQPYM
jgi:hypothetical protein